MRRLIAFSCDRETLIGSLDDADGATGLLIVSGGNELRMGAHRGMAELAQSVAAAGHPVFRFDPRGIGDSTGANRGFRERSDDIEAAARAFYDAAPRVERVVALGNCDAASAIALFQDRLRFDGLILANPWIGDGGEEDGLPPASAIRARYAAKLRDPREWWRALRGGTNISRIFKGLRKIYYANSQPNDRLFSAMMAGLDTSRCAITVLLAARDNTALAFADAWQAPASREIITAQCDTASHSFARDTDKAWLREQVLAALAR